MITKCKMRLPEEGREEISRRVQECCFANGIVWGKDNFVKHTNEPYLFICDSLTYEVELGNEYFENRILPEITPPDFLEKYEAQPEYFKLDLSKCDLTERKRLWEIIKKAIPHYGKREIKTGDPVAQYNERGLCSHAYLIENYREKEITWGYFLSKYVDGKKNVRVNDWDSAVASSSTGLDNNDPMKLRDDRPLSKGEQAYADSKVKEVPRETVKEVRYIDERPMPYRMGWEG